MLNPSKLDVKLDDVLELLITLIIDTMGMSLNFVPMQSLLLAH